MPLDLINFVNGHMDKANIDEFELNSCFSNVEDFVKMDTAELALDILLPGFIQVKDYKKDNLSSCDLTMSSIKYHNQQLLLPQNLENKKKVEKLVTEAVNHLKLNGYIMVEKIDSGPFEITEKGYRIGREKSPRLALYAECGNYPWGIVHLKIRESAQGSFCRGKYDSAIFESFKEVEIYLRDVCGLNQDSERKEILGRAFSEKKGKLKTNSNEKKHLGSVFEGALGAYRNPPGHKSFYDVLTKKKPPFKM